MKQAASLILKSGNKVLMVKRRPMGNFGSYTVFPGGIKDSEDADLKVTALREMMEETGLILTNPIKVLDLPSRNTSLLAGAEQLVPLSTWSTPPHEKVRFHTTFYLAITSDIPECVPDGKEIVDVYCKSIPDLLQDFRNGKIYLMPPQWVLLSVLNGDIQSDKFKGIINPELIYRSDKEIILALPGDYKHSKNENKQFRIIGKLESGRVIDYTLVS